MLYLRVFWSITLRCMYYWLGNSGLHSLLPWIILIRLMDKQKRSLKIIRVLSTIPMTSVWLLNHKRQERNNSWRLLASSHTYVAIHTYQNSIHIFNTHTHTHTHTHRNPVPLRLLHEVVKVKMRQSVVILTLKHGHCWALREPSWSRGKNTTGLINKMRVSPRLCPRVCNLWGQVFLLSPHFQ